MKCFLEDSMKMFWTVLDSNLALRQTIVCKAITVWLVKEMKRVGSKDEMSAVKAILKRLVVLDSFLAFKFFTFGIQSKQMEIKERSF